MFKFIISSLILISVNTHAASWELANHGSIADHFFDSDSVRPVTYNNKILIKAWERVIFKKPTPQNKVGDEMLSLTYFDCDNGLSGSKQFVTRRSGKVVDSLSASTDYPELSDVVPDSITEKALQSVCATYEIKTGTRSYMKAVEK